MRIIGIGNPDRGDDAAGLLVVRRLQELGVDARVHRGDALSLIDSWSNADSVLLVDAVVTGSAPGTVHQWDARALPPEAGGLRFSTHALSCADAIRLAASMGHLPASLIIIGIEGSEFVEGIAPSPAVRRAVEHAAVLCMNLA